MKRLVFDDQISPNVLCLDESSATDTDFAIGQPDGLLIWMSLTANECYSLAVYSEYFSDPTRPSPELPIPHCLTFHVPEIDYGPGPVGLVMLTLVADDGDQASVTLSGETMHELAGALYRRAVETGLASAGSVSS